MVSLYSIGQGFAENKERLTAIVNPPLYRTIIGEFYFSLIVTDVTNYYDDFH